MIPSHTLFFSFGGGEGGGACWCLKQGGGKNKKKQKNNEGLWGKKLHKLHEKKKTAMLYAAFGEKKHQWPKKFTQERKNKERKQYLYRVLYFLTGLKLTSDFNLNDFWQRNKQKKTQVTMPGKTPLPKKLYVTPALSSHSCVRIRSLCPDRDKHSYSSSSVWGPQGRSPLSGPWRIWFSMVWLGFCFTPATHPIYIVHYTKQIQKYTILENSATQITSTGIYWHALYTIILFAFFYLLRNYVINLIYIYITPSPTGMNGVGRPTFDTNSIQISFVPVADRTCKNVTGTSQLGALCYY